MPEAKLKRTEHGLVPESGAGSSSELGTGSYREGDLPVVEA
jgi:hypothetical protein